MEGKSRQKSCLGEGLASHLEMQLIKSTSIRRFLIYTEASSNWNMNHGKVQSRTNGFPNEELEFGAQKEEADHPGRTGMSGLKLFSVPGQPGGDLL